MTIVYFTSAVSYECCLLCVFVTWFFSICKCSFAQMHPLQSALYSHIVRYSSCKTTFTTFIKNRFEYDTMNLLQVWEEVRMDFGIGWNFNLYCVLYNTISFSNPLSGFWFPSLFGSGDRWKWMSVVHLCVLDTDVDIVCCNKCCNSVRLPCRRHNIIAFTIWVFHIH